MIPPLCKQEREGMGIKEMGEGGRHNGRWGQVKEGGDGERREEGKQGGDDGNLVMSQRLQNCRGGAVRPAQTTS